MAINFDKALGVHPQALLARSKRTEILANNIANADTPGFKAKDLNFEKVLSQAKSKGSQSFHKTHQKHFDIANNLSLNTLYRAPHQADTGDGNSVDLQMERNAFIENSMQYQASLKFLTGRFLGLKKALSGGR